MNRLNTLLTASLFIAACPIQSQTIHGVAGADAWMQGGISSTLASGFSVQNNPSQMSWVKRWQAGVYNEQRFFKRELSLSGVGAVIPTKIVDMGVGLNYFGFTDFNQQRFTFSLSKKLAQTFSLGMQLNYVLTNISGYGTAGAFVLGAGVSYRPVERIMLGFSVYNPGQQELSDRMSDKIPSYARLGIQYQVNERVHALAEADQQTGESTSFKAGIRYEPFKRVAFGIGASTRPVLFNFGMSVKVANIAIDMAAGIHQVLGITPKVSLRFPSPAGK